MKYIKKKREPVVFQKWKGLANEDWQPDYSSLMGEEKRAVVSSLLEEQGYICSYCEIKIDDECSHIEHFRPQDCYQELALDYSNMLCSCNGENQDSHTKPLHCGHKKGNTFCEKLISPLSQDCESHFKYLGDGTILAATEDDDAGDKTIKLLGLNCDKLKCLRSAALIPFLDPELTDEDLKLYVRQYIQPNSDGRLNQFVSTIRYVLGNFQ